MRIILSLLFAFLFLSSSAQNRDQVIKDIEVLCSDDFAGRGYVNDGDKKAADYIAKRYEELGLKHFGDDYFQELSFNVNTFPSKMFLELYEMEALAGKAYIVHPGSPSVKGTLTVFRVHEKHLKNKFALWKTKRELREYSNWALIYDAKTISNEQYKKGFQKLVDETNPTLLVELTDDNFVWWVATKQEERPKIMLDRSLFRGFSQKNIIIDIEAEIKKHTTQNVIGYIEGTEQPDSFIAITAHYDHLGMMGQETIFPGANDNASGTAMMMDFAKYYKEHPPKYSICFIAFCGEEAGLLGSRYYTRNPLFPLKQISFLVNMDLMGSGEDGIMAVNGKVFTDEWNMLDSINKANNYLTKVSARPKAANSDHYYFVEKGVKGFFFYLMGPYSNYHDIEDVPEALPLALYNESFKLIRDFIEALQNRS